MMTLFFYEWMKLIKKRLFFAFIFVCIVISSSFYAYEEWSNQKELLEEQAVYDSLEQAFVDLTIEEGSLQINALVEELSFYNRLNIEDSFKAMEDYTPTSDEFESDMEDNVRLVEKYYESEYANDSLLLQADLHAAKEIKTQYDAVIDHQNYLNEMIEKANDSISVSVFHQEDSFSYRNVTKTIQDYEHLRGLDYQIGQEHSIVSISEFTFIDLCLIIILFIFVYYLFHYERETGLLPLITSTKRGKISTILAKFGVLFVGISILVLLFYGSLFLLANQIYGFGDWNRPVQSMAAFKSSVFKLSVKEYIIAFFLLKYGVAILFSLVLTCMFALFQRTVPVFFFMLGLLGISLIMYTQIHPGSYINGLKYVNLWAFWDTFHFIVEYRNLNIFGYPFSKLDVSLVIGGSLIVLLIFLICLALLRQWIVPVPFTKQIQRFLTNIRKTLFKVRKWNYPLQHESYKLLLYGKGWIVFLLAIVITIQMLQVPALSFTADQSNYNQYMRELAGPLDEEKVHFIEKEAEKFETYSQDQDALTADYHNGVISIEEYETKLTESISFERMKDAFDVVLDQYYYLLFIKGDSGYDVGFVNQMTSSYLFDEKGRDTVLAILLLVLLGSMFSLLFTIDYRNNAMNLLRVTKHGRARLFTHKILLAYIAVFILYTLIYLPKYILLVKHYPSYTWHLPIQSIEAFQGLSWSISIWQFVLLSHLFILFGSLISVHVMHVLSILVRRQSISLFLFAALFIVPLAVSYVGVQGLDNLPWNAFFLADYQLRSENAIFLSIFYVLFILIIGISMLLLSWRLFHRYKAGKE